MPPLWTVIAGGTIRMTAVPKLRARILSVGTELTMGHTVDTNSAYLARELAARGLEPVSHETVADDLPAIVEALRRAAERADAVIVTGGLGPTPDDLTRQALAEALGVPLTLHEESLWKIEEFFRRRNRTMQPGNRVQAMVPLGAKVLENPVGTAPGLEALLYGATVFVLPGVPSEMRTMFQQSVAPRLPAGGGVILHRVVRLFGAGESDFAELLGNLLNDTDSLDMGTTVAAGLVSVHLHARGETPDAARQQADERISQILARAGEFVLGVGEETTMESVVGTLLRQTGRTLATAESCTGGLVGQLITSVPGASAYYLGGVVAYSNTLKERWLGVPAETLSRYGAVSEPTALAMARAARERTGADYGLAITGIAGPDGGTAEKPVGLVYTALAGPRGEAATKHLFPGEREMVRLRAALAAMNTLRLELRGA